MAWVFQPAPQAAAQLLTNDGLAVGDIPSVTATTPDGSASGFTYNSYSSHRVSERAFYARSKFTAAARMLLLLGVQLVVATGAGVSDTTSAPSASASGAAAASGGGSTATASAPAGSATGGNQGTAVGAGASVSTSAPGGSAAGAGAATGAGVTDTASAPSGSAAGLAAFYLLRQTYTVTDNVRTVTSRARAVGRFLLLHFGASSAFGAGATATALAPSGSASGGGTAGIATGAIGTAQAFPPAGTVAPPFPFNLQNRTSSVEKRWIIGRSVAGRLLILAQGVGSASGAIDTATASPPQGGASGDFVGGLIRQSRYFETPTWHAPARSVPLYLALLNSYGPDFPTALQGQWDGNLADAPFYTGRAYPWTLIILGRILAAATGAGVTVTSSAPTGFATGDNAGFATGAGSTATTSAPAATALGNTTVIASGVTAVATAPSGSATGPGNATGQGAIATSVVPDVHAEGGGAGVAMAVIDTATAIPPTGFGGASFEAVGAGATAIAFEVNALASGDAAAVGNIGTVTTSAPEISGPVTIGEIRITIRQNRTKVTIT
jgi:hypothetical protein